MAAKDCIDAIHDAAGRTLSDDEVLEIAGGQVPFFFSRLQRHACMPVPQLEVTGGSRPRCRPCHPLGGPAPKSEHNGCPRSSSELQNRLGKCPFALFKISA